MTTPLAAVWNGSAMKTAGLGLLLLLCCTANGLAQPRAFFQFGTPNAVENRLSITRVPVSDSAGAVKYYDVSLVFNVDGSGRLTLNMGATKITASPNVAVGAFSPGIYSNSRFPCEEYVVGAPGIVGGGRVSGSIGNHDCGLSDPSFNASWVSGSIAGHPNETALRAAGISFQGYSWGVVGEVGEDWKASGWHSGDLIGVIQSGQQLIVHNFGKDNREDTSVVFTRCPSCS